MLQDIRDNSQGLISKVIIGLIVAVFALFGVESIIGGFATAPPVAEVNGEEITEQQLQFEAQQLLASIGASVDSLDQGLVEQIALNQIIEETVLRQSAQRADMTISSDRLDRSILENPQFQLNGVFDGELALRTMQSQYFSVPLYRQELASQMLLSQTVNAFSASSFVTEAELTKIAALSAQTRDFRYLSIPLGTRTLGTAISDEEIESYYNSNRDEFRIDETVSTQYVLLDKAEIANEIEVDEAQLRAQYEAERDSFEGSAEKRASHILLEIAGTEAEAVAEAQTIKQRLDEGEDFAALALEFSIDTVSAEEGGDIGYTDGTAFPEEVEDALNTMGLNEISEPVVSEFGVHILKLTEDQENVFQSYEEVASRIETELKAAEVELIYAERLETLSNLAFESGDLTVISEDLGLEIQESSAFGRNGGQGIFANPQVIAAAFTEEVLLESNNSDVVEIDSGRAVVLRVLEVNEASYRPLDEVSPEIAVILRTEMEREAVQALGDDLLSGLESGEGIDALLGENFLEWVEGPETARTAATVNREILSQLFSMPAPEGDVERSSITLDNGTFVLLELSAVNAGTLDSLDDTERDNLAATMENEAGSTDFQGYLANLRDSADVQSTRLEDSF